MAYTLNGLIAKYNALDANMLSNAVIKKTGLLQTATTYLANKQLAHPYNVYNTLPTAGIRSLADGVATSTVEGTYATQNLTLFSVNGAWDKAYVGNDLDSFYNRQSPMYFASVAQLA